MVGCGKFGCLFNFVLFDLIVEVMLFVDYFIDLQWKKNFKVFGVVCVFVDVLVIK